jgi:Spy/CpxP family protein refolding chaperone
MAASTIFLLLLVLACPLMMMLMMRGGYGHGGHRGHGGGHDPRAESGQASTDDLRNQRDGLERLIEERERSEEREFEPAGWGRR